MLTIKNFSKTYKGNKKAVSNLNLEIAPGDIYGFIGHNGAGKTTTLKAIAGIHGFEEGEILIGGVSVREHPLECKKNIAYIPDNPDLYEYLTGIQYLNFIADIFGIPSNLREERIKRYCDTFELTHALGDLISSYSHGMKQKLAITSALIHDPKLMLLDEPFVGLDPKATVTLKNIMKEMCENGASIFFSTHVLEVAEKLCNKVAIIKNGQLVISGKTEDIIKNQSLEDLFMAIES